MPPTASKVASQALFQQTLSDVLRKLRAITTSTEEEELMAKLLKDVKAEVGSSIVSVKVIALQKAMYFAMLGHNPSYAFFPIVEVMADPNFSNKRIAYMAASLCFTDNVDVIPLTTALVLRDLRSTSSYEQGLALGYLSAICTPDLARDVISSVVELLDVRHPAHVRKKAVVCLYKLFLEYPDALRPVYAKLKEKVDDSSPDKDVDSGVRGAVVCVLCELSRRLPATYLSLAIPFYSLLSTIEGNWALIKIVKVLGYFIPHEPRLVKKLTGPFSTLLETSKATSVKYECYLAIMGTQLATVPSLLAVAVEGVQQFLQDSDQNLCFMGLEAAARLAHSYPKGLQPLRKVLLRCVEVEDTTIRKRAVRILPFVTPAKHLMSTVMHLFAHSVPRGGGAASPDGHFSDPAVSRLADEDWTNEVILRIVELVQRDDYAMVTDLEWYMRVLLDLYALPVESFLHGALLQQEIINLLLRAPAVRTPVVQQLTQLLLEGSSLRLPPPAPSSSAASSSLTSAASSTRWRVVCAAAFACGEYPIDVTEESDTDLDAEVDSEPFESAAAEEVEKGAARKREQRQRHPRRGLCEALLRSSFTAYPAELQETCLWAAGKLALRERERVMTLPTPSKEQRSSGREGEEAATSSASTTASSTTTHRGSETFSEWLQEMILETLLPPFLRSQHPSVRETAQMMEYLLTAATPAVTPGRGGWASAELLPVVAEAQALCQPPPQVNMSTPLCPQLSEFLPLSDSGAWEGFDEEEEDDDDDDAVLDGSGSEAEKYASVDNAHAVQWNPGKKHPNGGEEGVQHHGVNAVYYLQGELEPTQRSAADEQGGGRGQSHTAYPDGQPARLTREWLEHRNKKPKDPLAGRSAVRGDDSEPLGWEALARPMASLTGAQLKPVVASPLALTEDRLRDVPSGEKGGASRRKTRAGKETAIDSDSGEDEITKRLRHVDVSRALTAEDALPNTSLSYATLLELSEQKRRQAQQAATAQEKPSTQRTARARVQRFEPVEGLQLEMELLKPCYRRPMEDATPNGAGVVAAILRGDAKNHSSETKEEPSSPLPCMGGESVVLEYTIRLSLSRRRSRRSRRHHDVEAATAALPKVLHQLQLTTTPLESAVGGFAGMTLEAMEVEKDSKTQASNSQPPRSDNGRREKKKRNTLSSVEGKKAASPAAPKEQQRETLFITERLEVGQDPVCVDCRLVLPTLPLSSWFETPLPLQLEYRLAEDEPEAGGLEHESHGNGVVREIPLSFCLPFSHLLPPPYVAAVDEEKTHKEKGKDGKRQQKAERNRRKGDESVTMEREAKKRSSEDSLARPVLTSEAFHAYLASLPPPPSSLSTIAPEVEGGAVKTTAIFSALVPCHPNDLLIAIPQLQTDLGLRVVDIFDTAIAMYVDLILPLPPAPPKHLRSDVLPLSEKQQEQQQQQQEEEEEKEKGTVVAAVATTSSDATTLPATPETPVEEEETLAAKKSPQPLTEDSLEHSGRVIVFLRELPAEGREDEAASRQHHGHEGKKKQPDDADEGESRDASKRRETEAVQPKLGSDVEVWVRSVHAGLGEAVITAVVKVLQCQEEAETEDARARGAKPRRASSTTGPSHHHQRHHRRK